MKGRFKMDTMKAAVFHGKKDMRLESRAVPVPTVNQMLIKIEYCGICGTDIESYQNGNMIPPGMVFGHENVGIVCALGEGVAGYALGDRVLCGPPTHCAENCTPCQNGQSNLCLYGFGRTAGIRRFDGGYAQYMLINDVAHTMLIKVDDNTDPKEAVLFDIVCVAVHAIRKSGFRIGDNVVVSGTGSIGLSAIRLLRAAGANRIVALGTTPSKFDLIRSFGADIVINARKCADIKGELCRFFGSDVAADIAFECAGNQQSLQNCLLQCVKPGGEVMLVGSIATPIGDIIPNRFAIKEINLTTSFVYTPEEARMYLEMISVRKLRFSDLVTDIISLEDCVTQGLERQDRSKQLKVLINPWLVGGK